MLFTDNVIECIAHHTNLYSAQELRDPIKTSPQEILDFLAVLLLMGVLGVLGGRSEMLRQQMCQPSEQHLRDHTSVKCPPWSKEPLPLCLSLISAYRNGMD